MRFIVLHDHNGCEILVNAPKIRYAVREPNSAFTHIGINKGMVYQVKETPSQIRDLGNQSSGQSTT